MPTPGDFDGRIAIVTGASRGIGRATAERLARGGARVLVNYHANEAAAAETVSTIEGDGGTAIAFQADVRDAGQVQAMTAACVDAFGGIDILVNNAGVVRDNLLTFMSDEQWDDVMDTSLRGAWYCTKSVARIMMRARRGRIVNVASDAALLGDVMRANYSAAKAGLLGFTRTAARELARSGITVNAVAPGIIETDLLEGMKENRREAMLTRIPMGRFGAASEAAAVIAFLASDASAYMTGQVVSVDGGLRT